MNDGEVFASIQTESARPDWLRQVAKVGVVCIAALSANSFVAPAAIADDGSGETSTTSTTTITGSTPSAPVPTTTAPSTAPAPPTTPSPGSNTGGPNTTVSHDYDYNMHAWGKYDNDCGVNAAADAVSFAKQKSINPDMTLPIMAPWYQNGRITDFGSQPYMSGAAPQLAKQFNLKYEHVHSIEAGQKAIKAGGAAIFLAVATANSPVTHGSHYVEGDKLVNGNIEFHDPNQTASRHFDKSVHSLKWMHNHGFLNQAWVLSTKQSSTTRNVTVVNTLQTPDNTYRLSLPTSP